MLLEASISVTSLKSRVPGTLTTRDGLAMMAARIKQDMILAATISSADLDCSLEKDNWKKAVPRERDPPKMVYITWKNSMISPSRPLQKAKRMASGSGLEGIVKSATGFVSTAPAAMAFAKSAAVSVERKAK